MKTVKVLQSQSLLDLAVAHYGTVEAVSEILRLNPGIENDPAAMRDVGEDVLANPPFRLDVAVKPGFALKIDETSKLIEDKVIKKITNEITTYETWQELSPKLKTR